MPKISITPSGVVVNNIQNLPDVVIGDATNLKATFDKTGLDEKSYLNNVLIPELNGDDGASKIGCNPSNLASDNVNDALEELQTNIQNTSVGAIPDDSLTDVKLSNTAGQIKDRVTTAESEIDTLQADTTNIKSDLNYLLATVVSRQIRIPKVGNLPVTKFRISSSIATGTQITISLDSGATSLPLVDTDLGAITKLESGIHEVFLNGSNYILNPFGQVKEKVSKSGDTMTGNLNVPTINSKTPAYAEIPTETVISTGFASGWTGSITWTKNQFGKVVLDIDLVKNVDISTGVQLLYTLPVGIRPSASKTKLLNLSTNASVSVSNSFANIEISSDGSLYLVPVTSTNLTTARYVRRITIEYYAA